LLAACDQELDKYSESDNLEVIQLLVDSGADPGIMLEVQMRGESCNAIHYVVSHKRTNILRIFLSSEKGRAAVNAKRLERCQYPRENNGNGETTMAVSHHGLENDKANRDMTVQLLKAGADPSIEDQIGLSANLWLKDGTPKYKELSSLIKKAEEIGTTFWDSEEVRSFIENGANDSKQCDNGGTWSDAQFRSGESHTSFQRCGRCKKVYCKCIIYGGADMILFSLRYFKAINRHCCCVKIVPRNVKKRDG
jgi:hypothetical protein